LSQLDIFSLKETGEVRNVELIMMVVFFTALLSLSAVLIMALYFLFWLQRAGN